MKICPLCKVKFDDSAQKAEKTKIPKSFWWSIIAACAFIGALYLIYSLVYTKIYF